MPHPLENDNALEGNVLNDGGYVGVDPIFQTDPKVKAQGDPFAPAEVKEEAPKKATSAKRAAPAAESDDK